VPLGNGDSSPPHIDVVPIGFTGLRRRRYLARYALVHEDGGYEFLVDTHKLYGLSLIKIRRGRRICTVWVDEDEVTVEDTDFGEQETAKIRDLAQKDREELQMWFVEIRNDWKRDRLERNCLID